MIIVALIKRLLDSINDHALFISNEQLGRPQRIVQTIRCTKCSETVNPNKEHYCLTKEL